MKDTEGQGKLPYFLQETLRATSGRYQKGTLRSTVCLVDGQWKKTESGGGGVNSNEGAVEKVASL